MHICIHDFSGHPFQIQLSRELASRGHQVTHLYCKDIVGAKGNLQKNSSDPESLQIEGLSIGHDINRYNFAKRLFDERKYGQIVARRILVLGPDIVICSNTPLDSLFTIRKSCKKLNVAFIFWLQDILGLATRTVLTAKMGLIGRLVGEYYIAREQGLLRSSQHVIPISDDFLATLDKWSVPRQNTTVVNNWAPLDEMPAHDRANDWSRKQNLIDRPVALYSGALGLKHNPALLLELAQHLDKNQPEARVIVISEGYGADWLREQNAKFKLKTLIQLPFQPFSELPQVLASSDVLLAILEPEAGEFCVPSKVLSYMCVGRPVVLAASDANLASKLIVENHAGSVVPPTDSAKFSCTVSQLLQSPDVRSTMGANARKYAETAFNIKRIGDTFENIIESI